MKKTLTVLLFAISTVSFSQQSFEGTYTVRTEFDEQRLKKNLTELSKKDGKPVQAGQLDSTIKMLKGKTSTAQLKKGGEYLETYQGRQIKGKWQMKGAGIVITLTGRSGELIGKRIGSGQEFTVTVAFQNPQLKPLLEGTNYRLVYSPVKR